MSDDMNKPKITAETKDESFVASMGKDLFDNYIVPGATNAMHNLFAGLINTLSDTAQAGIDKGFRKIGWNGSTKVTTSGNQKEYNKMYVVGGVNSSTPISTPLNTSGADMKLIFLNSEDDARALIQEIKAHYSKYNKVTIGDVYNKIDPPINDGNPMRFKWGWTSVDNIGYRCIFTSEYGEDKRGKYLMDFPKPKNITNI